MTQGTARDNTEPSLFTLTSRKTAMTNHLRARYPHQPLGLPLKPSERLPKSTRPRWIGLTLAALLATPAMGQFTSFADRTNLGIDDVEITPDGRYAVGRTSAAATQTFIVELETGQLVYSAPASLSVAGSGPANDAVAVSNARALTLGARAQLIDLTTASPTLIAEIDCGYRARDLELTPDGRLAVVRGGSRFAGSGASGTFVIDLASGAILLNEPSEPPGINAELGNDMVAVTADHGVSLSIDPNSGDTSVLVVELVPPAGGGPRVVLDTLPMDHLAGRPMDVAASPDGQYATVRSEDEVALLRLDGTNTRIVRRFSSFPGPTIPFLETSFDTVLMTDSVWATITLGDPSVAAGYLNVQDHTGTNWFVLLTGSPRDLTVTPDGETLLVHTGRRIYEFDLGDLPTGGGGLSITNSRPFPATHSGVYAGLDSVVCTNELAAVIAPSGETTRMRLYDLTAGPAPRLVYSDQIEGWPVDIDLTPDGAYAIVSSTNRYLVVDARTLQPRLEVDSGQAGWFPWCDGAAVHPDHAAAFGIGTPNAIGWVDTIDLVSREALSCGSLANSTGSVGELFALGSTRVSEDDLELHARRLPPGSAGLFVLGDASQASPLGGGVLCISGNLIRLGLQVASADGTAFELLDIAQLPPVGGGVLPGSTWYAQFVHRDLPQAGGLNFTNASSLLFQ